MRTRARDIAIAKEPTGRQGLAPGGLGVAGLGLLALALIASLQLIVR